VEMYPIPSGISIDCSVPTIPTDERNLCHKAARLYLEKALVPGGVHIRLTKCIPDGAGMGGGSSDAAAVLRGMCTLYPAPVDLFEIALKIGADVPFFLYGGTCLCEGIGEKISPLLFLGKERLSCVVAKNTSALSTPEIYRLYDRMDSGCLPDKSDGFLQALSRGDLASMVSQMQNDLELPALSRVPQIGVLKESLLQKGAVAAMMTGSGSAVFALFSDEAKAKNAASALCGEKVFARFCTLL